MDALKSKERSFSFLVFGCGVALGLTGLYGYYRTRKVISKEMRSLSLVIENLKQEVNELRQASQTKPQNFGKSRPSSQKNQQASIRFQDENDGASDIASGDEEFYDFVETENKETGDSSLNTIEKAVEQATNWLADPELDKKDSYNKIEQLCDLFDRPAQLLCLLTKASNMLVAKAAKNGNLEEKKRQAFHTLKLGEEALKKNPNSAECHKWYAIAIGGISDFVPTKEKIQNGSTFKQHVDTAIALSPNDATLHHMQGRFCNEIANLSWIERKVASTLFAEVPAATLEDAMKHFKTAYKLKKEWKENILFLAKCSVQLRDLEAARRYIEEGLLLPILQEDDEISHKEFLLLKNRYIK